MQAVEREHDALPRTFIGERSKFRLCSPPEPELTHSGSIQILNAKIEVAELPGILPSIRLFLRVWPNSNQVIRIRGRTIHLGRACLALAGGVVTLPGEFAPVGAV